MKPARIELHCRVVAPGALHANTTITAPSPATAFATGRRMNITPIVGNAAVE